jgi:hypothetical protein
MLSLRWGAIVASDIIIIKACVICNALSSGRLEGRTLSYCQLSSSTHCLKQLLLGGLVVPSTSWLTPDSSAGPACANFQLSSSTHCLKLVLLGVLVVPSPAPAGSIQAAVPGQHPLAELLTWRT